MIKNKFLEKYPQLKLPSEGTIIEIVHVNDKSNFFIGNKARILKAFKVFDFYLADFMGFPEQSFCGTGVHIVEDNEFKILKHE